MTYKDVRVYNDVYNNIHLPISIAYDLVKNGGTFSIKVTQGDKVIEIDADNFTYNTEWDCEGSNYYYYGNNKIGAIGGC